MGAFLVPADIGNRGLQHCGSDLMDASLGFSETSERARQVSYLYDKLRRAELRRNVWNFATRRACLRPLDLNTRLLTPALWSSSVTYFLGSVVSDQSGTAWISRVAQNLNNPPSTSPAQWEPYFGPLSVSLYDSAQSYFSGEVVYTAAGDGTCNTYLSLVTGNTVHPALPNQWAAATVYATNQVVQQFPAWASGTTYAAGATVSYTDGNVYASLVGGNLNHPPATSPAQWALMPALTLAAELVPAGAQQPAAAPPPTTPIAEWQQQASYSLGSFAIFNAAVYVSIAAANTGNFPNAAGSTFWAKCSGGVLYMSLFDLNAGNNPANAPLLWSNATTYASGAIVGGSDGLLYQSQQNGNLSHQPIGDPGAWWKPTGALLPWTTAFTQGGGNSLWMQIGGAAFPMGVGLASLNIIYPLNSGPVSQSATRNVYRLPAGYLRNAPQDPKAGIVSYLGAPGNRMATDWTYENDYLVTWDCNPIVFRFVADAQDVSRFDDMFCEGLACRIGLEVAEKLTQSTGKLATIAKMYAQMMTEARTVNAIEGGAEEPPLDDFIACRM